MFFPSKLSRISKIYVHAPKYWWFQPPPLKNQPLTILYKYSCTNYYIHVSHKNLRSLATCPGAQTSVLTALMWQWMESCIPSTLQKGLYIFFGTSAASICLSCSWDCCCCLCWVEVVVAVAPLAEGGRGDSDERPLPPPPVAEVTHYWSVLVSYDKMSGKTTHWILGCRRSLRGSIFADMCSHAHYAFCKIVLILGCNFRVWSNNENWIPRKFPCNHTVN